MEANDVHFMTVEKVGRDFMRLVEQQHLEPKEGAAALNLCMEGVTKGDGLLDGSRDRYMGVKSARELRRSGLAERGKRSDSDDESSSDMPREQGQEQRSSRLSVSGASRMNVRTRANVGSPSFRSTRVKSSVGVSDESSTSDGSEGRERHAAERKRGHGSVDRHVSESDMTEDSGGASDRCKAQGEEQDEDSICEEESDMHHDRRTERRRHDEGRDARETETDKCLPTASGSAEAQARGVSYHDTEVRDAVSGVTMLRLSNGCRVTLKKTRFDRKQCTVCVHASGGIGLEGKLRKQPQHVTREEQQTASSAADPGVRASSSMHQDVKKGAVSVGMTVLSDSGCAGYSAEKFERYCARWGVTVQDAVSSLPPS
jgi:hypothetical protein